MFTKHSVSYKVSKFALMGLIVKPFSNRKQQIQRKNYIFTTFKSFFVYIKEQNKTQPLTVLS